MEQCVSGMAQWRNGKLQKCKRKHFILLFALSLPIWFETNEANKQTRTFSQFANEPLHKMLSNEIEIRARTEMCVWILNLPATIRDPNRTKKNLCVYRCN